MSVSFRQLDQKDYDLYKKMETKLADDYMLRVFDRLTSEDNALFGLFQDDQLVAVAGYTLFEGEFAMMGRLRSDSRFRQNGYGTLITEYIYNEAKKHPDIKWVGANTEKRNTPAQKVLKKLSVPHVKTLYAAQTDDLTSLTTHEKADYWQPVESVEEKRRWIEKTYLHPDFDKTVFPLEAYYPFPATPSLFTDERLKDWKCYENSQSDRVVFMWEEEKGKKYLHVVYPWSDFMIQPGLFAVISEEFSKSKQQSSTVSIWMDLTEEEATLLPANHPFELSSPWMLHGHFVNEASRSQSADETIDDSLSKANQLLADIEDELDALEQNLSGQQTTVTDLQDRLNQVDSDS